MSADRAEYYAIYHPGEDKFMCSRVGQDVGLDWEDNIFATGIKVAVDTTSDVVGVAKAMLKNYELLVDDIHDCYLVELTYGPGDERSRGGDNLKLIDTNFDKVYRLGECRE